MNTNLNKQHRFMIITVLAGLILAIVAFLKPVPAEAGLRVDAVLGSLSVSVASDTPRGVIVQTGPRSFRCDTRIRPPRPSRGHFVWVPGHFEKVLEVRNCRKYHKGNILKPGKGNMKRTKLDHLARDRRGPRAPRHNHYTEVWVPGSWERV